MESKSAVRGARRTCTYWATFNRPAEAGLRGSREDKFFRHQISVVGYFEN